MEVFIQDTQPYEYCDFHRKTAEDRGFFAGNIEENIRSSKNYNQQTIMVDTDELLKAAGIDLSQFTDTGINTNTQDTKDNITQDTNTTIVNPLKE
jgi:hypothetical protein